MPISMPSRKWSELQQEYWNTHVALIRVLSQIGPKFPATARLSLFWFRNRLGAVYGEADEELLATATELIDRLVILRTQGGEPNHKNGKYV